MPSRRSFVASLGCALAAATAGCPAARGEPQSYELRRLALINRTTEPHTVAVSITAGGTTYFEETFDLAPDAAEAGDVLLFDALPDEARPYVVEGRLDDEERQTLMEPDSSTADCRELVALVEPPAQREGGTGLYAYESACYRPTPDD